MKVQQERLKNQNAMEEGVYVRPSRRPKQLDPYSNVNETSGPKSKFPKPERWLKTRLGRKWDDVYSEICRKFLKDEPNWYWEGWVLMKSTIQNGKIYNEMGVEITNYSFYVGFVCPHTGLFKPFPKNFKEYERELAKVSIENLER